MASSKLDKLLKRRMEDTQQSSERQLADDAYEQIFQKQTPVATSHFCDLPIEKLRPFFTADIGFHPYPPSKLKAFSEQLAQDGLFERVIVRPISDGYYEILAGHNRTNAGKLAGWETIPCEIVGADDERAITIAIATNLMRRQDLTIMERGRAYKTLLDAKNRCGQRNASVETFGDSRQRYNARQIVAEFFGVTEYEIRKAIKLTQLIPELALILEQEPKKLNLACAELITDYDTSSQAAFIEMCKIEGYQLNKATVKHIIAQCPPPSADRQAIFSAWRDARATAEHRMKAPPKKISFDRRKFAPYLSDLNDDTEIESLFLEFLQARIK